MAASFDFKQFSLSNESSAQKVGTDGVLLGGWVSVPDGPCSILDVGTGTGVIALMLAQRCPSARIEGIDTDFLSVEEATANFASSPWPSRVSAIHCRLQDYNPGGKYDIIVSNPPFFNSSLKAPDARRAAARHDDSLTHGELADAALRLLGDGGILALIYPEEEMLSFASLAESRGLHLSRMCRVSTVTGKKCRRILAEFTLSPDAPSFETLSIHNGDGSFTEEYIDILKDFYLKF